jgi:hypothetical protein
MSVPDELMGAVFGKCGASLKEIQHTSQANVVVSSRCVIVLLLFLFLFLFSLKLSFSLISPLTQPDPTPPCTEVSMSPER